MDNWISVKDRLPKKQNPVLVYCETEEQSVYIAHFDKDLEYWLSEVEYLTQNWCKTLNVTHWQPLPEPPKGE